jgi:hypothetical protein
LCAERQNHTVKATEDARTIMRTGTAPGIRRSIRDLQDGFDNKKPLEAVMRAWKGVKELGCSFNMPLY